MKGARVSAQQNLNWQDEDDADDDGGGRQDSSVLKELRRINAQQAKRLKELEDQVTSFTKESRATTVKNLLESRELNPKIAAFIPEDVEATAEALDKWIADYGDVFGVAPKEPTVTDESLGARRQMDEIGARTQPPVGANDLAAAIASATTVEELDALIARSAGQ
jgi:hypothetical protein